MFGDTFPEEAMSLDFDVFMVDPKPIPSAVPGFEAAGSWPGNLAAVHLDADLADDEALLVDCLITTEEGGCWSVGRVARPRTGYVYITHPHADHFLGLAEILAAFPQAKPVALTESIPAMEEQISPGYLYGVDSSTS